MNTVKGLLGIKTKAQKTAEANQAKMQEQALNAQKRSAAAAAEDAALARSEQAASGRRLRGLGRRTLAFMGSELGVTDSLAPSGA